MKYIINARDYNPDYWNMESIFYGGYDSDAKYISLSRRNFSFLEYGDVNINTDDYRTLDKLEEELGKEYHVVRIYGYCHSMQAISTTPFSCQWDSGIAGLGLLPKDRYSETQAKEYIEKEISHENDLLTGDYYYVIDSEKEYYEQIIDSCNYQEIKDMKARYNAKEVEAKEVRKTIYTDEDGNKVNL